MHMKIIAVLWPICFYSSVFGQIVPNDAYYMAAVVEYATLFNKSLSPDKIIEENVKEYVNNIRQAAEKNADIIVFPECGLTSTNLPTKVADLLLFTTVIPDATDRIIPCTSNAWSDVLRRLSCAARNNEIYVVVNLPEQQLIHTNDADNDTFLIFNTNVVFDRTGAVIAKYRKYNLFVEPGFNVTDTPDITTFTTDFGVTFGTFICFDILFAKPALQLLKLNPNVTDIAYSTAWFSELPFLTAVQTQAGWARSTGVNLLASGYNNPRYCSGGSGVYRSNGDIDYIIPVTKLTTLIVTRVPKIKRRSEPNTDFSNTSKVGHKSNKIQFTDQMETLKENMKNYTTVSINETSPENLKLCHGIFCCSFTVEFVAVPNADYHYRLVVYDGPRVFGRETNNVQICGIVACKSSSKDSCGERSDTIDNPITFESLSVKGNFKNDDSTVVFPSNTLYDLSVLSSHQYNYTVRSDGSINIIKLDTVGPVNKILGFGIYSITKNSATNSFTFIPVIVLINLAFLYRLQ